MKSFFYNASLLLVGTVAALIVAEVLLRLWTPGVIAFKAVRVADERRHHALKPLSSYVHSTTEFTVEVRTNANGFRDRDFPPASSGQFRIAMIGDSFTEGWGVPVDSCFAKRLERSLNATLGDDRVVVMNLGIASYSPLLEYLLMKELGPSLRPDLVIMLYDLGDGRDDSLYSRDMECDALGIPVRIHPTEVSYGRWNILPRGDLKFLLQTRSYLYAFVTTNLIGATGAGTLSQWRSHEIYYPPTARYVLLADELCRSLGARFVLCVEPPGHHVGTREWQRGRLTRGFRSDSVYSSSVYDSLSALARLRSIPYLNMLDAFRRHSDGTLYFAMDPHWTSRGHAVAADTLERFLTVAGLLPQRKRIP